MTVVFLDTETTGLSPSAEVWEIGMIVRGHAKPVYDGEWLWQVRPVFMRDAEPMGLSIGRFYERFVLEPGEDARCMVSPIKNMAGTSMDAKTSYEQVARWVALLLNGATWVGAVPSFDELRLGNFVERNGWKLTHHYHLIDVEPLMAGFIAGSIATAHDHGTDNHGFKDFDPRPPWKSKYLTAALGVRGLEAEEHTALGDARWAMNAYDAVFPTT